MAKISKATAGKQGDKVRSDCYFEIELKRTGGIKINVESKVESMYGDSIRDLIKKMCGHFGIKKASIYLRDYGALPMTIMARFELAAKKLFPESDKEYLPDFNKANKYKSSIDRVRRTRLYLPGNEPKFYPNAGLHEPDAVILDLEDSVAHSEKAAAQLVVRNALRTINFYGAERMVRINQLPKGLDDLAYVIPHNVHVILIPKCESADNVIKVDEEILRIQKSINIKSDVYLMPIIESALGVEKAFEIASASVNVCALAVGLEDYTADIGVERTSEGHESFVARSRVVNAAKAAGVQAIDTVYSDVANMEGLRKSVIEAKSLGFEGKGCIHPRQIKVVHEALAPSEKEIEKAKKIVIAFEDAEKKGLGVISLGSKMIDAPVVKRAQHTLELALINKLIDEDWKNI